MSKYSPTAQKAALDETIALLRRDTFGPDKTKLCDVLGSVRDQIASWEKYHAQKGRETARGLDQVYRQEIRGK